MMHFVDSYKYN